MTTNWQDDPYEDDDYEDDITYYDNLFSDYYEESNYEPTLRERLANLPNRIRWHIVHLWDYTLGMKRCPICGQRRRQGCTDDCLPF